MNVKRFSEKEVRGLLAMLENPVVVVRRDVIWLTNEPFLALCGRQRDQGPLSDLIAPEERNRFAEHCRMRCEGTARQQVSGRFTLRMLDGRHLALQLDVQPIWVDNEERCLLANILMVGTRSSGVGLAERLVETTAALVTAHTDEEVRQVAQEGIHRAGLSGRFLRYEGGQWCARDRLPVPEDVSLALEALASGRPVFGGASLETPSHVYLPLVGGLPEVVWVSGAGLRSSLGSVLALFSKVVSAALTDSRLLEDLERRKWEMESVAEVARFVAQPVPPTPEAFLERIAAPLGAEAVALHVPTPGGEFALVADFGLEASLREHFSGPAAQASLAYVVASNEGGMLSNESWERSLRDSSNGRFACGVAVRLARGGHVRGTLQALRAEGRPFGPGDLRLLGTFADLLVTLLEQRRLRTESARQLTETRLLLDLARTTSGTLEMAGILDVAADFLTKLLDVSNCFILLYEERNRLLRGAAASAAHRDFFKGYVIPLNSPSVSARVARERRTVVVEDVSQQQHSVLLELTERFQGKAVLGLPIMARDELIGVVIVDDTRRPRPFSAALIELAEATCSQLALSIENARLYESLWASYAELAATRAEMVKRERLAALGELSAIVAHEVRNPLGVIFNAVSSLRRLLQPSGDSAMLLDILGEESDRLNRMVGDLLDFTRPREPMLQPEDLNRVLEDALDAARVQHGNNEREVVLSAEVEPGLPPVPMDRRLIRQALVNVVVNAIQSLPQGGVVRVFAQREERGKQELLRIDVVDQGPGIPPELIQRVFEPFFTTKAQGTGLGLAVVKRIVDEHRGEISLASDPGLGTTFTFRLPLHRPAPSP